MACGRRERLFTDNEVSARPSTTPIIGLHIVEGGGHDINSVFNAGITSLFSAEMYPQRHSCHAEKKQTVPW